MKLELRKAMEGTHFVVCICSQTLGQQLVVPLSPSLSDRIQAMVRADGIKTDTLILPPLRA